MPSKTCPVGAGLLLGLAALVGCGGGGGGAAPGPSGAAVLIEASDAGSVYSAQVAMDASGNALAVWVQSDGTRGNIWSNRYSAATSSWGAAVLLETNDVSSAYRPQVALDASGDGLAVWDQSDGLRNNIWSSRYTAATGTWGAAVLIEADSVGGASAPQLAIAGDGNALAVWSAGLGTWSNRYTAATGTWGTAELIETGAGATAGPQIAVDASGNALAIWVQFDTVRDNVWSNRYTAATHAWGTAALIETSNLGNAKAPQIAMDAAGNALAVWVQSDGTRQNVWSNRYAAATHAWGAAALIETDDVGDADLPQLAMDAAGNALAVWQQDGDASAVVTNDIWSNRYTAGSGWGTAAPIETSDFRASNPQIAMNASGDAMAVWIQLDGTRQNSLSRRYTAGAGWGAVAPAESADADALYPQVAIDGSGAALVVWEQVGSGGVRHDLWAKGL